MCTGASTPSRRRPPASSRRPAQTVGRFINAPRPDVEIVFTKNATEALNLVAHSYGRHLLAEGKAVLLTELEHHANLVPWLMLAAEREVELRYIPVGEDYRLDLSDLDRLLDGVGLVGVSSMSNVLGTINDLQPDRRGGARRRCCRRR